MTQTEREARASRFRRRVIALLVSLLVVLMISPLWLGYQMFTVMTNISCNITTNPDAYGLSYESITVKTAENLDLPAYFFPAETDATVMIAGGYGSDASYMLPYVAMFHDVGLNVLLLEPRVCVGLPSTFGYLEAQDMVAAYDYLTTRDDVDPMRVGTHGFSAGGAAALYAAAQVPEIRAVAPMGNYSDFYNVFGRIMPRDNFVERLYKYGARVGYERSTGVLVKDLRPIEAVKQIAPRPILFIYGSVEPALGGGRDMYAVAGDTAQFWLVEGVGHGGYIQAHPDDARDILGGFFVDTLLNDDNNG